MSKSCCGPTLGDHSENRIALNLLYVPNNVLLELVLAELSLCAVGRASLSCRKLLGLCIEVAMQVMDIQPQKGESSDYLLRAIRVMQSQRLHHHAMDRVKDVHIWRSTEVRTCGFGYEGVLGHGNGECKLVPTKVEALAGECSVNTAAGFHSTAALTGDGSLFTWGLNLAGNLGHGCKINVSLPRKVESLTGIVGVSLGTDHMALVTRSGSLITVGQNLYGQLGQGQESDESETTVTIPRIVETLQGKRVVQVAAGTEFTVVLTVDGDVFTFGKNHNHCLGHPDPCTCQYVPLKVEALAEKRVLQVTAGYYHTAVLTTTDEVFTFGNGRYGQLGHNLVNDEATPRLVQALCGQMIRQVSGGGYHTAVLTKKGQVLTFGFGKDGQLGHGDQCSVHLPKTINFFIRGGQKVVQVAAGWMHTVFLCKDGTVFTCGDNTDGRLGHAHMTKVALPLPIAALSGKRVVHVAAGHFHTVALSVPPR